MEEIVTQRWFIALYSTLLIPIIFVIVGRLLDKLQSSLITFLARRIGAAGAIFIANYITFIGVVHHELSHALFAFVSGARIIKIDIFKPNGGTLGQVKYATRGNKIIQSIQSTLASIAPMLTGFISEYFLIKYIQTVGNIWIIILMIYLIISIFLHMTLSKQDIKVAISGLPVCVIIIYIIMYITQFNIMNIAEYVKIVAQQM